jgi:hypothetical protein
MPPTLTVAMAVKEILLREVVGLAVGIDRLGMLKPEGREKLGMEKLGMETLETAGVEVAIGKTRVTAALAPWMAVRCVNRRFKEGRRGAPKTREIIAENFMFDALGARGSDTGSFVSPLRGKESVHIAG